MENNEAPAKARGKAPPWQKGQSGNPAGTKRGSRHRTTLLVEGMYSGEAEAVTRKVIELALAGDVACLRIATDRLLPPVRERPCSFKLPKLETLNDASNALAMIIAGVTTGELLPSEGESLSNIVNSFLKSLELAELETRLAALEQAHAGALTSRSPGAAPVMSPTR
jgi:Family of unknown function (DUF5681)